LDDQFSAHVQAYSSQLRRLIRQGRELQEGVASDLPAANLAAVRVWQRECGAIVNELSGGSKAHWLARAFSEAFMARDAAGAAVEEVSPVEIVGRLVAVLERAVIALSDEEGSALRASTEAPAPRRFDFVHDAEIRPVLEQAYDDGRRALEQADYRLALLTYSGILEAIVTDALQHCEELSGTDAQPPHRKITDWSFEARLEAAERVGLIGSGCARLPAGARAYRDAAERNDTPVSESDARRTAQVLHVVMRDLNPGR